MVIAGVLVSSLLTATHPPPEVDTAVQAAPDVVAAAEHAPPDVVTVKQAPPELVAAQRAPRRARRAGNLVIVRKPARNYGSGYLGDYGRLRRAVAPTAQFRAAAASDNGCLIIGDSIANGSLQTVVQRLRRTHSAVCAWDAWSGRPTEGAANALADHRAAFGLPSTIIVISGSNDIFNPPLFAAQARRVLAVAGTGRRVIWVNVFARRTAAKRYAADVRNSARINAALGAVAARQSNVQVIDWYRFITSRARRAAPVLYDGIHPNMAGQQALASLIANRW